MPKSCLDARHDEIKEPYSQKLHCTPRNIQSLDKTTIKVNLILQLHGCGVAAACGRVWRPGEHA